MLGSSPLAAGRNLSLLLRLGLVLQLHRVMVILDIHQAAEGVQHLVEQRQDAQQGSKKVELDHRRHHHYSGTAGCKNKGKGKKIRQLKPVMAFELGYYRDAFKVRVFFISFYFFFLPFKKRLSALLNQTKRYSSGNDRRIRKDGEKKKSNEAQH